MTTDHDSLDLWRAQLAGMPLDVVVAWLREQGWVVYRDMATHQLGPYRIGWDCLPAGWPPLGDADLPFDAERDA